MTGASVANVKIGFSASALHAAIAEFEALRSSAPESVSEHFVGLGEIAGELFRVRSERCVAAGASETIVFLEPSDGFLRFLAALRAGNFDLLARDGLLDIIRHDSVSVGSVSRSSEGPSAGESQGSVVDSARNSQGRVN